MKETYLYIYLLLSKFLTRFVSVVCVWFVFGHEGRVNDADQVLLVMGQQMGELLPHMGGPEHGHAMAQIFGALCAVEETTVRSAATASLKKILSSFSSSHRGQFQSFLELFKRLAVDDTNEVFYSRASACQIVSDIYRLAGRLHVST